MKGGRAVLVALVASVAVVGWFVALFEPQRAERRRLGEQLTAAQHQEQDLRATLVRLRHLAADQGAQQAQLDRLRRLVPLQPDLAGFILAANDAAVRSQVDWVSVAPAPAMVAAGGGPSAIAVTIAVSGGFFPVLEYVRRLETLERLIVVDSLQLSSGGQAAGALSLSATLSARIFTTAAAPGPADSTTTTAQGPAPAGAGGG